MALATVSGSLKDLGLTSMGNRVPKLVFEMDEELVTLGSGTIIPCEPIYVTPASDGTFTVNLQPSLGTNPYIPYKLTVLWSSHGIPRSAKPRTWRLVVPEGGGNIADMIAIVTPDRILTKGDKGDPGDTVAEARLAALEADKWRKRLIPAGDRNINAWTNNTRDGVYELPNMTEVNAVIAAGGVLPVAYPGNLTQESTTNGTYSQVYKTYGDESGVHYRSALVAGSGAWTAWGRLWGDRGVPRPGKDNIDDWAGLPGYQGTWDVPTTTVLNTLKSAGSTFPVDWPGKITHEVSPGGMSYQTYESYGNYAAVWYRASISFADNTFKPWTLVSVERGAIPAGSDIDTWFSSAFNGEWDLQTQTLVDAAVAAGCTLPVNYPGRLKHESTPNGLTRQRYWSYGVNKGEWVRSITAFQSGAFSAWERVGAVSGSRVGAQRIMRVSDFKRRRGNTVGTAGKAVVTLIMDHGTNNISTEVMPLLRQYGIPATLALNPAVLYDPGHFRYPNENATSWSMIQGWCLNDGLEIYNHGRTHQAFLAEGDIINEIVGGRDELSAALPKVAIEGWVQIGASTDPEGFGDGSPMEKYWTTVTGQVILDNHAVVTGTRPGQLHTLAGELAPGFAGTWLDTSTTAATSLVNAAILRGAGVVLRLHPEYLNTEGKLTTAQLTTFIESLVALRDAGKLEFMSASGFSLADSTTSAAQNLFANPAFSNSGEGWTTTGSFSGADAVLATGQYIEQTVPVVSLHAIGTVRALTALVDSTGGATVTLEAFDAATSANLTTLATHTVTAGDTNKPVRDVFTIPYTGTTGVRVRITFTAGSGRVRGPKLTPA